MLECFDTNQKVEFISKEDKTDPKTVFIFKPLSGAALMGFSKLYKKGEIRLQGDDIIEFLDVSIVEIKNTPDGLEKKDILRALPLTVLEELIVELNRINKFTAVDAKN